MTFGEFLKQQRESREWKQPEAAQEIAIEQSYLSKLENNKAIPSPDIFDRLMKVYQFSIQQISEQVQSSELEKLKDIVVVREFIISSQKRRDKDKRRFLVWGTLASMFGAFLLALGVVSKDHVQFTHQYESKGVLKADESIYLFDQMPQYQRFVRIIESESKRKQLERSPLFERLDYIHTSFDQDRGLFYQEQVEGGVRMFNKLGHDTHRNYWMHYLAVSLGVMFLVGGLNLFYVSRRW